MPSAVLIDLFNTLVPGGDTDRAAMVRDMAAELGVDPDEFARMVVVTWPERMRGVHGDLVTEVAVLAQRLGIHPTVEQVATAAERRFVFGRRVVIAPESALAVLAALRAAGLRLAIVSNCTFDSAAALRSTPLAAAIDALALSCEVHHGKPEPEIYRYALDALDVKPADAVYVGDGADGELEGAATLGMRVIQSTQYVHNDPSWTGERISTITDLPHLLASQDN